MVTRTAWLMRLAAPITVAATLAAAPQNPVPTQGQIPTFRAQADYVSFDVRVLDQRDNPVPNLQASQFEVYEDGVLQRLDYFEWFFGGRAMYTSAVPSAPVRREGLILPPRRQQADSSGRIFIIFIDDLHLMPSDTPLVRSVLMQIRDTLVKETDLVGFVSSGYSSIETDLSYDYGHKRFNAAIEKTMGSGMEPQEIVRAAETAEGPAGLRFNAHTAMKTVYGLLEQAARITDRRKSFIYVSSGYNYDPFKDSRLKYEQDAYGAAPPDDAGGELRSGDPGEPETPLYYTNPFTQNKQRFADADMISDMGELIRSANRSGVTYYTVDPRGLVAGTPIDARVSNEEYREWILTTTNTLIALGNETGGFCICNTNDFKSGLERIDALTSDYYQIGYKPSNPDPMHVSRRIEVKVKVDGVRVIHKPGYTLKRPSRNSGGVSAGGRLP